MNVLTGVYGAARFATAIAAGDVASEEIVEQRREECRGCPSRVRKPAIPGLPESDWCGEPLKETATTCGCLVYGKTMVLSERCPQGKW